MAKADDIIEQLIQLIETRLESFNGQMPKIQQDAYAVVLDLASDLDTSNGSIKPTMKNIKLIGKIKAELNKVVFSKEYTDQLDEIVKTYEQITKLQNAYFTAQVGKFKVPAVLGEIQKLAQNSVIEQLGDQGIDDNFIAPVRRILEQNVTTGGSRAEFIEQVRDYIVGTPEVDGRLVKYTKQIVTDSLNQYSANYTQVLSDDLGLVWYKYVGSNKETTRPFCKALTAAKADCLPFIHKSQLPDIVEGQICGEQVPIYDKTGLPHGMIPGTNAANFQINRGGYNCNHQLQPVPSALVPASLRRQFEGGARQEQQVEQVQEIEQNKPIQKSNRDKDEAVKYLKDIGVKQIIGSSFSKEHLNSIIDAIDNTPINSKPTVITDKAGYEKLTNRKINRKSDQWMGLSLTTEIFDREKFEFRTEKIIVINSQGFKNPKEMTERKIKYNEFYEKSTGKKWYFNQFDGSTHFHELGHLKDLNISNKREWIDIADKWHKESGFDLLKPTTGEFTGLNGGEAFAEAFAAYFGNQKKGLPNYVIEFFDKNVK